MWMPVVRAHAPQPCMKINVIDNRNLVIDTFDSDVEPKAGQWVTLNSGTILMVIKVRKNVNKKIIEVMVEIPLRHQKFINSRGPFDK